MKKLVIFSVFCGVLAVLMGGFFAPSAKAVPGDINGDGQAWTLTDMIYLINYLFHDGPPPPNPVDADVDGSPGINMGDLLQIADYFVTGSCWPLPYTGADVRTNSQIRFTSDLILFSGGATHEISYIKISENGGPDLISMVIPLSYANQPNEVGVTLDSVSFDGSIIPPDWNPVFYIDDVKKTVLLVLGENTATTLGSGTTGVVARLYFTKIADGDPLVMSTTEIPPSHSFMLISYACASVPSPSGRILNPKLSLALNGDVNCDGVVDLGDVVYTINYLFKGGPPPCGL